jgi:hypothetical protein
VTVPRRFFPDNTVLINFTLIDRQDLLTWFLRGAGAWTIAIARECEKSAMVQDLGGMDYWSSLLSTPLAPTPVELVDSKTIAERMRKPGETAPAKHMGEAETIAVITRRQIDAVFLTDDHDAARTAIAESIPVASTTKILALAEAKDRLLHAEARQCLARLRNFDRVLGNPPSIANYDAHVEKLKQNMR